MCINLEWGDLGMCPVTDMTAAWKDSGELYKKSVNLASNLE
jgi:hypothetical protein